MNDDQTVPEIKARGSPLPPSVLTKVSQLVRMARKILVITILLVSLYHSDSRPQTFFSEFNQAFSNQGFFNGARKSQNPTFSNQGFFNGARTFPNPARKSFSRPNQPTARRGPSLRVPVSGSGDIIEQTRTQMDSLKNTIIFLARKPEAAPILEEVFAGRNNSTCITNMEEAIEALETVAKVVVNAGREMKLVVKYCSHLFSVVNICAYLVRIH